MRTALGARTSTGYGNRGRRGFHGELDVETALAAARLHDAAAAGEKISGPAARLRRLSLCPRGGSADGWHSRVRKPGRIAISPATDRRPERRPLTVTTGVRPRRPRVRPLGGRRVKPASSSKQL
ncbi:hypothetical protein [Streptomyces sp. NPDC029554]|uniref:hypothetical protein n=1 Tax=Streptomyces sp. NPDC029554 TaxID=3155126 RepID=UPI00340CAD1A